MQKELVFVLPSLAHGGAQKVILDICKFLHDKKVSATLLVLERSGELLAQIPADLNVEYLYKRAGRAFRPYFLPFTWLRLLSWMKRRKPHAILSTVTGMNLFVLTLKPFLRGSKLVVREATSAENYGALTHKMVRALYSGADHIICTSTYVKQQLEARGVSGKLSVIPNPVDAARIHNYSQKDAPAIQEHRKKNMVVALGRLVKAKGFDVLINAVAKTKTDFHLVIIGEGEERSSLESLIEANELGHKISLLGYMENPFPWLRAADLFVLSSRWEGCVNTVIEAMILDTPIVATDCKSEPGRLLEKLYGHELVPVEDADKLALAIDLALENKTRTDYGQVLQRYELEEAVNKYLETTI